MHTYRYSGLISLLLLTSVCHGSDYEDNYLRGLAKNITQHLHNINTDTSDASFTKVKQNFTAPSWRSLMHTFRKNGTNELIHKHKLQQTVAVEGPVYLQLLQQSPNTVWQAKVTANVKFDNASMKIQQRIVDDYIIRKVGNTYKVQGFSETITGEPTRVNKIAKHANSCPLKKR